MDPAEDGGRFMNVAEDDIEDVSSAEDAYELRTGARVPEEDSVRRLTNESLRHKLDGKPPLLHHALSSKNPKRQGRKKKNSKLFGKAARANEYPLERHLPQKRSRGDIFSNRVLGKQISPSTLLHVQPITSSSSNNKRKWQMKKSCSPSARKQKQSSPRVISLIHSSDDDFDNENNTNDGNDDETGPFFIEEQKESPLDAIGSKLPSEILNSGNAGETPSVQNSTQPSEANGWEANVLDQPIDIGQDVDLSSSSAPSSTDDNDKSSEKSMWNCTSCTFANPPSQSACQVCLQDRIKVQAEELVMDEQRWHCRACTLINVKSDSCCTACGARNRLSRAFSSPVKTSQSCKTEEQSPPNSIDQVQADKKANSRHPTHRNRFSIGNALKSDTLPGERRSTITYAAKENKAGLARRSKRDDDSRDRPALIAPKTIFPPGDRKRIFESRKSLSEEGESLDMWPDRFKPTSTDDLCVALPKKKVELIREWLTDASSNPKLRLLVLHGPTGAGKSTCIKVLAQELGLDVRTWKAESERASTANFKVQRSSKDEEHGHSIYAKSDMYVPYVAQLDDFAHFVRDVRFPRLQFSHINDSNTIKDSKATHVSLLLIESLPFVQSKDQDKLKRLHQVMQSLINASRAGTKRHKVISVIIHSSESESANPTEMRRLYSDAVMESPHAALMSLGSVPDTRLTRVLKSISKSAAVELPDVELDNIVSAAKGDMRSAILSLQFFGIIPAAFDQTSGKRKRKRKRLSADSTSPGKGRVSRIRARDSNYSLNHAVGKLIRGNTVGEEYDKLSQAKKKKRTPPTDQERAKLNYSPEEVAEGCPLEPIGLLAFMQHNCVDHFVKLEELSSALDTLCEADIFAEGGRIVDQEAWRFRTSGTVFPGGYISSLSARAVSTYRTDRANLGFHQVSAPRVWELERLILEKRAEQKESYCGAGVMSSSVHTDVAPFGLVSLSKTSGQDARDDQNDRWAPLEADDIVD